MKVILRDDESGVSEVIGTILILAMTVVLFATIIIWVTNIPTPTAAARLEIEGSLNPLYDAFGVERAGNITLRHLGGESLPAAATALYVTVERGSTFETEILQTKGVVQPPAINAGQVYGLMDGPDAMWNTGERWSLTNYSIRPSADSVTVQIIDTVRSILLWQQRLSPPAGTRPPLFLEKWADNLPSTAIIDPVETGQEFWIFAKVTDPDGDLDDASVYGVITYFYGTAVDSDSCATPQRMYDDGTRGDLVPNDGIFTLSRKCMKSPNLDWDGTYVLFNATDRAGHRTTSRMVLDVILGPDPGQGGNGTGGSGRPQNLRWNGRQGYNIFNATQWDKFRYSAKETRTFRGSEEVVVAVGSLDLENTFDTNKYFMWDPFSGQPPAAVVYGAAKTVTQTTEPSSTQAFTFLEFINGYYIFTYRFHLNDPATVGTNFLRVPQHPPNYFFSRYTLDILLFSSSGIRFNTTDSIYITDEDGYVRDFPQVQTFKDSAFTLPASTFKSTDVAYVQMKMFTVDPIVANVVFGNIIIKDYQGGTQLMRAPINGNDVNSPICKTDGTTCTGANVDAISINGVERVYRFSINFTRANQDPWIEGTQNYALTISSIRDTDETYANVATQLVVVAPLYKLDVVVGTDAATNNAWGTKDYSYYLENLNGLDRWRMDRIEFCSLSGSCKMAYHTLSIVYVDFDADGDLDTVSSIFVDNNNGEIALHRRDLDSQGNVIFTRFSMENLASLYCNALASGDVTGDGAPEVICGASNGHVWYYKNDGSWQNGAATPVIVDQSRAQSINSVALGDFNGDGASDIAVGGASGRLTWYPNLDKLGKFQNTGITDDWFPEGERTVKGNVTSGSYLNTFVTDNLYEQVREYTYVEPSQSGGTANAAMDTGASGWTYADWENGGQVTGTASASGGNPGAYVDVQMNFLATQTVSGYWYQSFTVSGSPPYTASLQFDRSVSDFGGQFVTIYAFVDTTPGNPVLTTEIPAATFTHTGVTSGWISSGIIPVPSGKITSPGAYYLKIAVRTTNGNSGSQTVVRLDNVALNWASTGGPASEMEQYWRISQVPNRPGTTFTFFLEARHSANTEGDNFSFGYSTNVVGNDPTTGTYTTMLWVNNTGDPASPPTFILPPSVAGKVMWIRALDLDRTVRDPSSLDTLFVDQMYIRASTPIGTTGASLSNPGDSSAVNSIDADRQDADGFWDLVVGTANGRIFKYLGGSGGLQTPIGAYYSPGVAVRGVKFGNVSGNQVDLEIVVAFGTTVRILTGFGSTGTVIFSALPTYTPANAIQVLGVGDVNGDGWDDVVVGTTTDVWYWSNQNNGASWTAAILVDNVGANIYTLALGDASKAQYLGR